MGIHKFLKWLLGVLVLLMALAGIASAVIFFLERVPGSFAKAATILIGIGISIGAIRFAHKLSKPDNSDVADADNQT